MSPAARRGREPRADRDTVLADPDLLSGRLFFAVPLPNPTKAPIEGLLPEISRAIPDARVAAPAGWHLTLAFLGQVRPESAADVVKVGETAVAGLPRASLRLERAGGVPHPRPAPIPEAIIQRVGEAAAASPPWQAGELCCYRSTLTRNGARYQVVRTFPLTG